MCGAERDTLFSSLFHYINMHVRYKIVDFLSVYILWFGNLQVIRDSRKNMLSLPALLLICIQQAFDFYPLKPI
jgi:hypothetical protein